MAKCYNKAKCFIKSENGFEEITYEELLNLVDTDSTYAEKKFIPLHGMLMEVSLKDYKVFYKNRRRQKYLHELSAENEDISFDMLTTDEFSGEDILIDYDNDVSEQAITKIIFNKLDEVLPLLTGDEQFIIESIYYKGMTERELAPVLGVSQPVINKRKNRILEKLKLFLEN